MYITYVAWLGHIIIISLFVPLYFNLIPINSWYGIRTITTMSSVDIWFRVNHIGAKYFIFAAIVCLFFNAGLLYTFGKKGGDYLYWVAYTIYIIPLLLVLLSIKDN
ncbi:MAG: SdpI family protein [Candidatus Thiodiazotropha endolucinida]